MVTINNLINFLPNEIIQLELVNFFTVIGSDYIPIRDTATHIPTKKVCEPIPHTFPQELPPLKTSASLTGENGMSLSSPLSISATRKETSLVFLGTCWTLKYRGNIIRSCAQASPYRFLLFKHKFFIEEMELFKAEFIFVCAYFL